MTVWAHLLDVKVLDPCRSSLESIEELARAYFGKLVVYSFGRDIGKGCQLEGGKEVRYRAARTAIKDHDWRSAPSPRPAFTESIHIFGALVRRQTDPVARS